MSESQITVHLMIKNNEEMIKETLDHINDLDYPALIVDCGSTDQTARICRSYGHKVLRMISKSRSKTRNQMTEMSDTNWQISLEPGEKIVKGVDQLSSLTYEESPYSFSILKGDIITKQVKMWKKGMLFKYPIYETTKDVSRQADVIVMSNGNDNFSLEEIEKWSKENPTEIEPYYYKSLVYLANGEHEKFLSNAEHYIFHTNKKKISATMLRYYIALVKFGIIDDYQSALKQIIMCIEHNPLMAEFWCLLGDMYLKNENYLKAKTFYENAIMLGSRRLQLDVWPMQISKYKSYPSKRIEAIDSFVKKPHLAH